MNVDYTGTGSFHQTEWILFDYERGFFQINQLIPLCFNWAFIVCPSMIPAVHNIQAYTVK